MTISSKFALPLATMLLASCVAGTGLGSGGEAATVLQGPELTIGSVLLDALAARVPGMRVSRPTGACPLISLRGTRGPSQSGNPAIYVDGTRMADTCILQQIPSAEVDRVELYPVASARVEGYIAGPGGLILVFRTRGSSSFFN